MEQVHGEQSRKRFQTKSSGFCIAVVTLHMRAPVPVRGRRRCVRDSQETSCYPFCFEGHFWPARSSPSLLFTSTTSSSSSTF